MTSTEPLLGSAIPRRAPARLLGADEVEHLLALQVKGENDDEDEDDDEGETGDDPRRN